MCDQKLLNSMTSTVMQYDNHAIIVFTSTTSNFISKTKELTCCIEDTSITKLPQLSNMIYTRTIFIYCRAGEGGVNTEGK